MLNSQVTVSLCLKISYILKINIFEDTGNPHNGRADKDSYPHDGRADEDSYPHDGRADKDSYPHDRYNQYILVISF